MKVGDLVKMIDGCLREGDKLTAVGIIVGVREPTGTLMHPAYLRRVCVRWSDGHGQLDWEPADWLEVISASR